MVYYSQTGNVTTQAQQQLWRRGPHPNNVNTTRFAMASTTATGAANRGLDRSQEPPEVSAFFDNNLGLSTDNEEVGGGGALVMVMGLVIAHFVCLVCSVLSAQCSVLSAQCPVLCD